MDSSRNFYPDLDALIRAVQSEAARRSPSSLDRDGNERHIGGPDAAGQSVGGARLQRQPFYAVSSAAHVRDFLPLYGPDFVQAVFQTFLHRAPEPKALDFYVGLMAQGRRSRWEVVVSVFLSPESRRFRKRFPGIWTTLLAVAIYRVPIVGPVASVIATLLNLPPYLRNLTDLDRVALATINGCR